MDFDQLDLSTETLRDLTSDDLARVAGGARPLPTGLDLETLYCPTRGDTFSPCEPLLTTNCS
jgi:hypothetical protein